MEELPNEPLAIDTLPLTSRYNYNASVFKKYRAFIHMCACYNTRTATDILVHRKCRLFSAGKIRALVDEFMKDRKNIEEKESSMLNNIVKLVKEGTEGTKEGVKEGVKEDVKTSLLPMTDYTRVMLLLQIIKQLPSYARVGGGMIICALAKYLTAEQWEEELDYIENSQDTKALWVEHFIRANMFIIGVDTSNDSQLNIFIEAEAEKMPLRLSFMRDDEYVELTFVD